MDAVERLRIAREVAALLCPGGTFDETEEQAKRLLVRTDTELRECLQRLKSTRGMPPPPEAPCRVCGRVNDAGKTCYWCGTLPV